MYEARQNRERVSRRIDGGGVTRQMIKIKDIRRMSLPLREIPIQKKTIKKNNLTKGIIQTVLVTDVLNTKDFSQVTDLSIWWAMAAEYHFQRNLPINAQNRNNLNPLNYIHSLSDYQPGAPQPQQRINVDQGDRVRMLTHGGDPNQNNAQHLILVNEFLQDANQIVPNINNNINGRVQVTPLYCYMGDNPAHRNLIPGIGQGPMLSPTMGSVSLRNNMAAIQAALQNAGNDNTWNHIINNHGHWIPINQVAPLNQLFGHYQNLVNHHGVNSQTTVNALKMLLNQVYTVVNRPYNDFTNYLINYRRRWWFQRFFHIGGITTGKGRTLWN